VKVTIIRKNRARVFPNFHLVSVHVKRKIYSPGAFKGNHFIDKNYSYKTIRVILIVEIC